MVGLLNSQAHNLTAFHTELLGGCAHRATGGGAERTSNSDARDLVNRELI